MNKNHDLRRSQRTRTKRLLLTMAITAGLLVLPCFAIGEEATKPIFNLVELMFIVTRAVGSVFTLFGFIQIGTSLSAHDPSQRSQGFMQVAGGLIILFSKEILSTITGGVM